MLHMKTKTEVAIELLISPKMFACFSSLSPSAYMQITDRFATNLTILYNF